MTAVLWHNVTYVQPDPRTMDKREATAILLRRRRLTTTGAQRVLRRLGHKGAIVTSIEVDNLKDEDQGQKTREGVANELHIG